jgi:hypothetical protein
VAESYEIEVYQSALRDGLGKKEASEFEIKELRGVVAQRSVGVAWNDLSQVLYVLIVDFDRSEQPLAPKELLNLAIHLSSTLETFVSPNSRGHGPWGTKQGLPVRAYSFALLDEPFQLAGFERFSRNGPR